MTLLDLSFADFRRFLTVLVDRRLLGSQCCLSAGLVANGIGLTKRGFLLHVSDDRMRVWRHKHTAYTPRNIQPTVPYGGGSAMV
jgi:hypothetical protein